MIMRLASARRADRVPSIVSAGLSAIRDADVLPRILVLRKQPKVPVDPLADTGLRMRRYLSGCERYALSVPPGLDQLYRLLKQGPVPDVSAGDFRKSGKTENVVWPGRRHRSMPSKANSASF
jgi:hypothetical protein